MTTVGQIKINNCQFTWQIENFSKQCSNPRGRIVSPIFQMNDHEGFSWQLCLYPYGKNESCKGFLSLFLRNKSKVKVDVFFKLIVSDVNGVNINETKIYYNFDPTMDSRGHGQFINRDSLLQGKNGLKDDILVCTCIIDISNHVNQVDINQKILNKYESLFYNENFSDLTIVVKRNHLKVHKSILSAGSPVFKAMLSHNMQEKNTNTIKITDVSYNIMKEVLLFIYSGKVKDINKDAKALLPVADKYGIEELKEFCEINIRKNVKIEDACEILGMAALYNCSKLKNQVIDFIVANIKEINNTAEFKRLNRSNPELFEEIISKIVEKNC